MKLKNYIVEYIDFNDNYQTGYIKAYSMQDVRERAPYELDAKNIFHAWYICDEDIYDYGR